MEASVVLAEHEHEQDSDAIAATGGRLLAALQSTGEPTAFQAHGTAVGYGALAALDLVRGDRTAAALHVREGYRQAVRTNDLPILGVVGLAVAEVALDAGIPVLAAEVAGASARLRGADDPGSPFVRRVVEEGRRLLGDRSWDEAYGRGRALDRAAAIARLDPDGVLDAPPDGSLDEDHPAPRVGDGVGPVVGAVQARRR